jgi:hypothetical protein
MTRRNRDLRKRRTRAVTAGSGQVTTSAGRVTAARGGTVVHRVVPAHLACRIGAWALAGQRDAWPAVAAIALGSFALVFSEVIPVGHEHQLSAGQLHRSGPRAGPGSAAAVA